MSDIHGKYDEYLKMLAQINFDKFSANDKIYILGDVIDRDSGGIDILKHIMSHQHSIELLMGNHERMMLDSLYDDSEMALWMYNGGYPTLEAYKSLSLSEQSQIKNFISRLKYNKTLIINMKHYELVHASVFMSEAEVKKLEGDIPTWALGMSQEELMLWLPMKEEYASGRSKVVFGHRCTKHYQSNKPYKIYHGSNIIGIDCGCAYRDGNGRLGCLRLDDGAEFYVGFSTM